VAGEVEAYWYWNRTAFLPRPRPEPQFAAAKGPAATVTALPVDRAWLLAATAAADPEDRAGAAYALGCAGEAAGGVDRLAALLGDGSPGVRVAAALGLGEHGGTRARFALVRAIATARDERLAAVATLALGLAAAADGALPAAALRSGAAGTASAAVREASCAAADLCDSDCLHDLAVSWLAGPLGASAPANAVRSALAGGCEPGPAVPLVWLQATNDAVRYAALAELVRGRDVDAAFVRLQLESASPQRKARAVLVVSAWRDFPEIATAGLRSQVPLAHGFGLAVHSRAPNRPTVASQVALAERADHVAEHRPLWLLACGLARDPAAGPRARIVLGDPHSDERLRGAAVDVLAMLGETAPLREAIVLDPSTRVRRRAADVCARHGTDVDVAGLRQAVAMTAAAEERAALLVSLGRTRVAAAVATLRDATQDRQAPAIVRRGAWLGLAHWLRWRGETPLANLARNAAHTWQPRWLLDVVDAVR